MSTRDASGKVLNAMAQKINWLMGGAADLYPSTKTRLEFEFAGDFQAQGELGNYKGRNFHFGIREHAMCAIVNGMVLTGLRAFGSGFLIFTDYARGALRLSSLMEIPALHIWTHDTISLGEDGPTHQPIEQLVSLRAVPGMLVIRPADANEMTEAYRIALSIKDHPCEIICSRQALPIYDRTKFAAASGLAKGAYVMVDAPDGKPDVILIGCGSEVGLCVQAWEQLTAQGIKTRVVSMPCWALFDAQDQAYRDSVLPPSIGARVTVEEASTDRLGALCRPHRRGAGHAHLRDVGADEGCDGAFWLHRRARGLGGKAGDREFEAVAQRAESTKHVERNVGCVCIFRSHRRSCLQADFPVAAGPDSRRRIQCSDHRRRQGWMESGSAESARQGEPGGARRTGAGSV